MPDIAATDVTFTEYTAATAPKIVPRTIAGGPMPQISSAGVLSFGDSSLTYGTGGIPLSATRCGMPAGIATVEFPDATDGGSGTLWQWDAVNQKLRGYSALGTEISGAPAATTVPCVIVGF